MCAPERRTARVIKSQPFYINNTKIANEIRKGGPAGSRVPCQVFPDTTTEFELSEPLSCFDCNVADAMLSLYEATGEEIYLAKGKALIDNITVVQNAVNGQIPTTWDFRPTKSDRNRTYWINCSYSSISSLLRLEKLLAERQK